MPFWHVANGFDHAHLFGYGNSSNAALTLFLYTNELLHGRLLLIAGAWFAH